MSTAKYSIFAEWKLLANLATRERVEQLAALMMRICGAALGYIIIALAARATTTQGFSDFVLLMSSAALFGTVATIGQESILLRDLPLVTASGSHAFRPLVWRSIRIAGGGLLFFALIGVFYGYHSFRSPDAEMLALLASLVIMSGWNELNFAVQRGCGHTLPAVFVKEIAWKLILAAGLAIVVLFKTHTNVTVLGWLFLVALVVPIAISSAFLVRHWRHAPQTGAGTLPELPKPSGWAFFALNFISQAGTQVDILVLGFMTTTVSSLELGAYYAAQRTVQILYLLPYGAAITNAPRIPLAFSEHNPREIARLSRQISRTVSSAVVLAALVLFFFRTQIMSLFRPEFAEFAILLPALALGPLASAIGGLHSLVAPMCGLEREYARARMIIFAIGTVVKIGLASQGWLLELALFNAFEAIVIAAVGVLMARRLTGVWII